MKRGTIADFVMASNFGRTAGGRETWAYGFLGPLLAARPDLKLRVHGMRSEDHADTTADLLAAADPADRGRLQPLFHQARRGRLPVFVSMLRGLRAWMAKPEVRPPDWSLAAGCVNEQILLLATPKLRRSFRIVWLRTILLDQRIDRIPRMLMPLARRFEAWLIGRSQLIIANGEDIADYYRRFGLTVEVIRNGVDAKRWHLPPPTLVGPLRVAYIGRLIPSKGINEFLAAAEIVRQAGGGDRIEFHVVGDGPHQDRVREAEARGAVRFHGPIHNDALPALLEQFDVCTAFTFVSPTQGGGGTSNALLEQMAAARVILAWNNIIFRQVVDGSSAWLVPQGDTDAVVRALWEIAADSAEARRRATAAQRFVRQFSLEAQSERFLALLRRHGLAD